MKKLSAGCLFFAALGMAMPSLLCAQGPRAGCDPPLCPPAKQICTCTTLNPVVETRYHKQQVVNYCDVKKTCYRQEQFCYTVPVTKVDCVTVDEGCYKTIWVPKPVVKQVPRTEYQQRVGCRNVPYEVCQKVPQVSTICVPEHRVRYVPGGTCTSERSVPNCNAPCGAPGVPPMTGSPSGTCHSCLANARGMGPTPDPSFLDPPSAGDYPRRRLAERDWNDDEPSFKTALQSPSYTQAPSSALVWQTRR
jgi:hypothetical protein